MAVATKARSKKEDTASSEDLAAEEIIALYEAIQKGELDEAQLRQLLDATDKELEARADRRIDFYEPQPKQLLFHKSKERNRAFFGGNRAGKSEALAAEMVWYMEGKHPFKWVPSPPCRAWLITQVLPKSSDDKNPQLEKLREFIPKRLLGKGGWDEAWNVGSATINFVNGSWLKLKSHSQDPDQFESEKLHVAFFDEICPKWLWVAVRSRLTDLGGDRVLGATVKRNEQMWCKAEIWDQAQRGVKGYFAIMASTWDNKYLAQEEKEALAADIGDPDMRKAVMGEDFAVKSGPYFKEFSPDWHVAKTRLEVSPRRRVMRGWDMAITHRYPACVWAQLVDGQVRVFQHYISDDGFRKFVENVQEQSAAEFPGAYFEDYCDPSAFTDARTDQEAVSCAKIMHDAGISPRRGPITWAERSDAIQWRLNTGTGGEAGFLLDPTAKCLNPESGRIENMMVDAFAEKFRYNWNDRRQEYDDHPEKNIWSHLIDALSYLPIGLRKEQGRQKRGGPRHFGKRSVPQPKGRQW